MSTFIPGQPQSLADKMRYRGKSGAVTLITGIDTAGNLTRTTFTFTNGLLSASDAGSGLTAGGIVSAALPNYALLATYTQTDADLASAVSATHAAATVLDSSSIDFTLVGQQITGAVLPAGVDHNSLANLAVSDVHTQYALLAGRAGGSTLYGGTAASENLILGSTSHATKGSVLVNPLGGKVGFGINTTPGTDVQFKATADAEFDVWIDSGVAAAQSAVLGFADRGTRKWYLYKDSANAMHLGADGTGDMFSTTTALFTFGVPVKVAGGIQSSAGNAGAGVTIVVARPAGAPQPTYTLAFENGLLVGYTSP